MKLRKVKPGDKIAMVSPASPLAEDKLEFMISLLADFGYGVKVMPHALDSSAYLAGSDEVRAADLMAAFDDLEVSAVMCTRGGYGCARLFPYLDLDRIAASRKMFLGFSDITTLHLALNRRGMPTVHSPMALTLAYPREPWVYESLLRVIGGNLAFPTEAPKPTTVIGGTAEGRVVGGCLCLLTDSLATPEPLDASKGILMVEEVDQPSHRVDAMLTHLLNAGIAQSAAGIVIGEMTRADERADPAIGGKPWRDIVIDRLAPLGKPMIIDFPFGHAKNMLTLPLNLVAKLDADAGTLEYLEPLCD